MAGVSGKGGNWLESHSVEPDFGAESLRDEATCPDALAGSPPHVRVNFSRMACHPASGKELDKFLRKRCWAAFRKQDSFVKNKYFNHRE
jgi:hypothetical protein